MRNRSVAVRGFLVLWIFLVISLYYMVHKPFQASNLLALGQALAGLGGAGLVVALGTGMGLILLSRLNLFPVERLVWSAAVGLGALSLVALGLGAAGLLRPWLLWTLNLIGLVATAPSLWRALRDAWSDPAWRPQDRLQALLAGYCGATLLIGLAWSVTPPAAWDGLVYHLTGPKLYLMKRCIAHPIDLPYLGFPQLTEMLFTWGIAMVGERAAAPVHWFSSVLTVLALVTAGRRWWDDHCGWLAAAVLLSARTVVFLSGWPYVEMVLVLYATLAFFALLRWAERGDRKWLGLTGVFAGLALSTKYTALALLPALGLACFLLQSRNCKLACTWQSVVRPFLILCAVALLVWSPWLVKNLLLTGNPIYPFFFGGIHWDDWRSWWYDRPGTGLAYTAPWRLLTAPWDATIWGVEGGAGYSATIGPLFLALLPLLLVVWGRFSPAQRRWSRAALGFCGSLYGFWLWGVARTALLKQTRLLFPAFGVLALMASAAVDGMSRLPRRPVRLDWLTRAVVAGVLALTLVGTLLSTAREQPMSVLLGFESEEEFLTRRLGWYAAAIQHINQQLPKGSVVLFLWEPRSYHCAVDCRPDALLDRWLHTTRLYGDDVGAIATAWRSEGITHLLFYRAGYEAIVEAGFDPVTSADQDTLARLLDEETARVADWGGVYEAYALTEAQGP